jgi:hypothetical protein
VTDWDAVWQAAVRAERAGLLSESERAAMEWFRSGSVPVAASAAVVADVELAELVRELGIPDCPVTRAIRAAVLIGPGAPPTLADSGVALMSELVAGLSFELGGRTWVRPCPTPAIRGSPGSPGLRPRLRVGLTRVAHLLVAALTGRTQCHYEPTPAIASSHQSPPATSNPTPDTSSAAQARARTAHRPNRLTRLRPSRDGCTERAADTNW